MAGSMRTYGEYDNRYMHSFELSSDPRSEKIIASVYLVYSWWH
jgi:hypothetical protein